jgi:hypothetical protein
MKRVIMIQPESWLNEPRFAWFVNAYHYASCQTRSIPALSQCSPEDLYFVIEAFKHYAEHYQSEQSETHPKL